MHSPCSTGKLNPAKVDLLKFDLMAKMGLLNLAIFIWPLTKVNSPGENLDQYSTLLFSFGIRVHESLKHKLKIQQMSSRPKATFRKSFDKSYMLSEGYLDLTFSKFF